MADDTRRSTFECADDERTERVVLDLLLQHYPAPWSVAELSRTIAGRPLRIDSTEPSTTGTEDALRDLYGRGLVHGYGALYIASRAAVEGYRLFDDDPTPPQP